MKLGTLEHDTETSGCCWCEPECVYEDPDTGVKVWVHKDTTPEGLH